MPIIGLTDREDGFGSGLPLIGRLHKGAPKEEKKRRDGSTYTSFGKDLEYFRVTFEPGYEWLQETWVQMYETDSENEYRPADWFSNIFLCGDTVDEAFPTWNEEWNSQGAMLHKCDGAHQVAQWNGSMYVTAKVSCIKGRDATGKQTGCGCKQTGRLMIALPDFIETTGVFGQFMVTTHSINDIVAVYKILKGIEKRIGRVSGIPFSFGRAPQEISAPKQEKVNGTYQVNGRVNVVKSLFVLYPDPVYTREILLPQMTTLALPAPQQPAVISLPEPAVDLEKARQTFGSGDKPRILGRDNVVTLPPPTPITDGSSALQPAPEAPPITDAPAEPEAKAVGDWAIPENLERIFKDARIQLKDDSLSDRELASLVGIKETDVRSKMIWDTEFLTGKIAFDAIIEAFNKPDESEPPVVPPPPAKTSAIVTRAMYHLGTDGKSRVAYTVFDVAGLAKQPRVYGRESLLKMLKVSAGDEVGQKYFDDNKFANMHEFPNIWYEIAKLEIEWEIKGSALPDGSDGTYLVVTKTTPVIESPAESEAKSE